MATEAQPLSIAEHIERGLERYGRGELVAAIVEWEAALKIDPANLRARQYIQYVRENFEVLADQFGRVVAEGSGAVLAPPRDGITPGLADGAALDALAAGWDLEEFQPEELPPPPAAAPEPKGIEVAPPTTDVVGDAVLAAVAQAVLDPFGLELTPPQGVRVVEEADETANTTERGGLGQHGGDGLRGEDIGAPVEVEREPEPNMAAVEDDFSSLIAEDPEDLIETQTKSRVPMGESAARKISQGPSGELVVEIEAELPEEYENRRLRTISKEFEVDLGLLHAHESSDQVAIDPVTQRLQTTSRPEMSTPVVDDSLLGTVDLDGPPAPNDSRRRPSFPELEVLPDRAAEELVATLPPPESPPPEPPWPPRLALVPPAPEPEPELSPIPAPPPEPPNPPDVFAVADAPFVRPQVMGTPVDAASQPDLEPPSRFEQEHTPLPAPYNPEAVDDEFDVVASQKGTTPLLRQPHANDAQPLTGISATVQSYLVEAKKCFERGELAEAAAAANEAFACDLEGEGASIRDAERQLLIRIFETQLGSLKRVPQVSVSTTEISQLGLDHRFGFMLSLIDGNTTFDDLLDIAGMPRIEAFRILESLLRQGVISA